MQLQKQFDLISRRYQFMKYAAVGLLMVSLSVSYFLYEQRNGEMPLVDTSVSTQNGQVSKINLPDGSEVWINSGTKLTYNNQFGISNRDLFLDGEAFFEVEKNKDIPFQVQGGELLVTAIGTEFCVSNYSETGKIDVILKEGAVKVNSNNDDKLELTMTPGEFVSYSLADKEIERRKVNTQHFISWKDGIIHFNNSSIEEIIFRLEKRYNQKFELDDNMGELHFKFTITNEDLSEVIDLLELLSGVKAEMKGDTIYLKKSGS